ncbi:dephospho-CoA kinase Cab5p [Monosporozyma unispora]|nr:Dephospho-CoA kinase cab5 [Kazachstania unispora]
MLIVGLTGGIACGKSTVSRRLKERHNLPIVDADKIAKDIVEPGHSAYNKIVSYFKEKIPDLLSKDGHLNRPALGKWVFAHPNDLKVLNGITHPTIRYVMCQQVLKYYLKGYSLCILDIPLLFESGLDQFCGVTINVVCDDELQLERLQIRNPELSIEDARNRIKSQMPMELRRVRSDYVINNDDTLEKLYDQVDQLVKNIKPGTIRTLLEYFPPFGCLSASTVYASRQIAAKWKQTKQE